MFSTITAWITGGWSKLIPWILGALGMVAAYIGIRQSGKDAAYTEIAQQQARQNAQALQVTQNTSTLSDADVDSILRKQFGTN